VNILTEKITSTDQQQLVKHNDREQDAKDCYDAWAGEMLVSTPFEHVSERERRAWYKVLEIVDREIEERAAELEDEMEEGLYG
jgi:hypothetical protein